jgi:hypothetical protein
MKDGGWWRRMGSGAILVCAFGVGTAACSSGPSAAAKGLCGSVLAAPPPNTALFVNDQTIKAGEDSGYPALDQAARNWLKALHQHNTAASSVANRQIVTECTRLGIPLGT